MRVRPILLSLIAALATSSPTFAQDTLVWNDARTLDLVRAATARRSLQLADTGLRDYTARANGYITFLAQLGAEFPAPPALIKSDQLAVEVYWGAPDRSKQRIIGRRDTLLLPTDQEYHRDHLGIIQNNFPEMIRLGDGDEVRDVPHPLSPLGLRTYDFRIADSLAIRTATQAIAVMMISVRPKDDRAAAAVGAVYVDLSTASVVRMTFSFTRAALLDEQLQDVSIILENGLVDGRFWLPRRQEIEIRRSLTWMDFPVRGIIRGRWEICCIATNTSLPPQVFVGPEITEAPRQEQRAYPFEGAILDALPEEVRALDADQVREVQEEARRLVREGALARARRVTLAARGISDFVRFNRVEGLAVGLGASQQLPAGFAIGGTARYGLEDEAWKGLGYVAWRSPYGTTLTYSRFDDFRELGVVPEVSLVRNSLVAQEFGVDWTNPIGRRGFSLRVEKARANGGRFFVEWSRTRERPLAVHAAPASGSFLPAFPADTLRRGKLEFGWDRERAVGNAGSTLRTSVRFSPAEKTVPDGAGTDWTMRHSMRLMADVELRVPTSRGTIVSRTIGGSMRILAFGSLGSDIRPLQDNFYFGGPVTAPGYEFASLRGRHALSQRLEFRTRIPFIPINLGRFGRVPSTLTLAPYVHAALIDRPFPENPVILPSVGLGALGLFDLLRVDVARGLDRGTWLFSIDIAREFWPVL